MQKSMKSSTTQSGQIEKKNDIYWRRIKVHLKITAYIVMQTFYSIF